MEGERQKREHIWTGIRTAKEAKKGGGDRRLGLAPATGGGVAVRWVEVVAGGWVMEEYRSLFSPPLFSYLKEARRHGSARHAVIGRHVAHHWTGSSGRTLEDRRRRTLQFSDRKKAIQLQRQEDIRAEGLLELADGNPMISWSRQKVCRQHFGRQVCF